MVEKKQHDSANGGLIGDLPWVGSLNKSPSNQYEQSFPPQILVLQNQSPWFQGVTLTETPGAFHKTSCLSNKTQRVMVKQKSWTGCMSPWYI